MPRAVFVCASGGHMACAACFTVAAATVSTKAPQPVRFVVGIYVTLILCYSLFFYLREGFISLVGVEIRSQSISLLTLHNNP